MNMSKLKITTASAALILMSSIAIATPNQDRLDELTILVLGKDARAGAFIMDLFSEIAAR